MAELLVYSKEHYELMDMFERENWGYRIDKEPKDIWAKGHIYQDGQLNALFMAYRRGYAYAKAEARS